MNPSTPQSDLSPAQPRGGPSITVEELQYHFEGLRSLFLYAMVALIVLTLTLDLSFLRKQMVFARAQLDDQRPKVGKVVADFRRSTEPLIRNFTAALQTFTASHHDFQPILERYRLILSPYMGTSLSAPAEPAPAKPPQAPPK